jgi:magnesium transporter
MRSWIDHGGDVVWEPAPSLIAQLVEAGQPFWLDIENPTGEVIDQLAIRLGLHPLAVQDSKQFGQRAKLQVYGNGAMLVGFGLDEQLRETVEVHCYYTTGFLITLRRAPSPALDALRQAGPVQPQPGSDPIRALHPLISSLYIQFTALALELDERLDALGQRVLHDAGDQELAEITAIRRRAAVTRRILTPGRDLAARTPLIQSLPGARTPLGVDGAYPGEFAEARLGIAAQDGPTTSGPWSRVRRQSGCWCQGSERSHARTAPGRCLGWRPS